MHLETNKHVRLSCAPTVAGVITQHLKDSDPISRRIRDQFYQCTGSGDVIRSHYFGGRFENIYLELAKVPDVIKVLSKVKECARKILRLDSETLKVGYWFNEMKPGDSTRLHNHDSFDELLSGVYYVLAPVNSGYLVVHEGDGRINIKPEEGKLVFFPSDMMHEVLENKSAHNRLSLGFNVGKRVAEGRLCAFTREILT